MADKDKDKKTKDAEEVNKKAEALAKNTTKIEFVLSKDGEKLTATVTTKDGKNSKLDGINAINMFLKYVCEVKKKELRDLQRSSFLTCKDWIAFTDKYDINKDSISDKKKRTIRTLREKMNAARNKACGLKDKKTSTWKTITLTTLFLSPILITLANSIAHQNANGGSTILDNNGMDPQDPRLELEAETLQNEYGGLSDEQVVQQLASQGSASQGNYQQSSQQNEVVYDAEDFINNYTSLGAHQLDNPDAILQFRNLVRDQAFNNLSDYRFENIAADNDKETMSILSDMFTEAYRNSSTRANIGAQIENYCLGETVVVFNDRVYYLVPFDSLENLDHDIPLSMCLGLGGSGDGAKHEAVAAMYNSFNNEFNNLVEQLSQGKTM